MSIVEREVVAPVVAPVTTRDVLHRAADLLEEFGWHQGYYAADEDGHDIDETDVNAVRFCAWGAICRAEHDLGGSGRRGDYDVHALMGLEKWVGDTGEGLAGWNDAQGRTKTQVIARLREAAEAA